MSERTCATSAATKSANSTSDRSASAAAGATLTPPESGLEFLDRWRREIVIQRVRDSDGGAGASHFVGAASRSRALGVLRMPPALRERIEALSGTDLSDVRVHTNSSAPTRLDARAFAQGRDIYLSPGAERHLPHEAWHIVQQRQGRVAATTSLNGSQINDDPGLEREAESMGRRAAQGISAPDSPGIRGVFRQADSPNLRSHRQPTFPRTDDVIQRFYVECSPDDPTKYGSFKDTETGELCYYKWLNQERDPTRYVESSRNTGWYLRHLYRELRPPEPTTLTTPQVTEAPATPPAAISERPPTIEKPAAPPAEIISPTESEEGPATIPPNLEPAERLTSVITPLTESPPVVPPVLSAPEVADVQESIATTPVVVTPEVHQPLLTPVAPAVESRESGERRLREGIAARAGAQWDQLSGGEQQDVITRALAGFFPSADKLAQVRRTALLQARGEKAEKKQRKGEQAVAAYQRTWVQEAVASVLTEVTELAKAAVSRQEQANLEFDRQILLLYIESLNESAEVTAILTGAVNQLSRSNFAFGSEIAKAYSVADIDRAIFRWTGMQGRVTDQRRTLPGADGAPQPNPGYRRQIDLKLVENMHVPGNGFSWKDRGNHWEKTRNLVCRVGSATNNVHLHTSGGWRRSKAQYPTRPTD